MVPADNNRGTDFPFFHQIINNSSKTRSLSVAKPANPRGKTLEFHLILSFPYPSLQGFIFWKFLKHSFVSHVDILGLPRESSPAEWTFAIAEKWPDVFRNKTRNVKGIHRPSFVGLTTNIVAIIKGLSPSFLEFKHGIDMDGHRVVSSFYIIFRFLSTKSKRFFIRNSMGNITVQLVVGRSLVSQSIGGYSPLDKFRKDISSITKKSYG